MIKNKNFFLLLLLAIFIFKPALAQEIQVDSKISAVTIYSGDALIKRVAQVKLPQGESKVVFSGIIPEIDENSIRAGAEGDTSAKILGASVKKEFLKEEPTEKIRGIYGEIQKLQDSIRKLEDTKKRLADEKLFLNSIRFFSKEQLPKELATKMPAVKELSDLLSFLDAKFKDNYSQVVESELGIREVRKQIELLQRELAEISAPTKRMKRSIIIELEALRPGNLTLEVSYRVKGAYWYPIYDARVNFAKQETELVSFAAVKQNTGEDWKDVEVTLSTARVDVSGAYRR